MNTIEDEVGEKAIRYIDDCNEGTLSDLDF